MPVTDADAIIDALGLVPHPEGGWYRQTWEGLQSNGRPLGTAIYFLLKSGERSHWHRVDAVEIWHWHAGSPLSLRIAETDFLATTHRLGPDVLAGESPQIRVPKNHWQAAHAACGWTLVSCTVTPGFQFQGFTPAAPGFDIPAAQVMDHKALLAILPPETRATLTRRTNRDALVHLAGHAGAILTTTLLIAAKIPFWPLLLPIQGFLITFLFTLEHEATHKTPFASPTLNEWTGRICGLLLFLPFEWFRYFHLAHHRWTNIPGSDPELASPRPATRRQWLLQVSGFPYWLSQLRLLASLATNRPVADYVPSTALPRVRREARLLIALYALAVLSLTKTPVLLQIWLLPIIIAQPALRLYLLAEHGDCPFVADMLQNTRTTYTTALIRFLAWNMPYHTEHHVFPAVPFHNLPALHRLMKQELRVTASGYVAFTRDYLRRF